MGESAPSPREVMIDLETLGTGPTAAIASIGLVAFDRTDARIASRHLLVDLSDAIAAGQIDASTLVFWLTRPDEARRELTDDPRWPLAQALAEMCEFIATHTQGTGGVWANGTDFDLPILKHALAHCRLPEPWHRRQLRDLRTLRKLLPWVPDPIRAAGSVEHGALDDAIWQATCARGLLSALDSAFAKESDQLGTREVARG